MDAKQSNGEISSDGECGNVPVPRFTAELKAKWIAALRSGEYKQCHEAYSDGDAHCCLDVLKIVHAGPFTLRQPLEKTLGAHAQILVNMNDGLVGMPKHSFPEIAAYIEANIPAEE